jgi:hypothetical protein
MSRKTGEKASIENKRGMKAGIRQIDKTICGLMADCSIILLKMLVGG